MRHEITKSGILYVLIMLIVLPIIVLGAITANINAHF